MSVLDVIVVALVGASSAGLVWLLCLAYRDYGRSEGYTEGFQAGYHRASARSREAIRLAIAKEVEAHIDTVRAERARRRAA